MVKTRSCSVVFSPLKLEDIKEPRKGRLGKVDDSLKEARKRVSSPESDRRSHRTRRDEYEDKKLHN